MSGMIQRYDGGKCGVINYVAEVIDYVVFLKIPLFF